MPLLDAATDAVIAASMRLDEIADGIEQRRGGITAAGRVLKIGSMSLALWSVPLVLLDVALDGPRRRHLAACRSRREAGLPEIHWVVANAGERVDGLRYGDTGLAA